MATVIAAALFVFWIGTRWYDVSWVTPHDFQASAWQGRIDIYIGRVTVFPISGYFLESRYSPGGFSFGARWRNQPGFTNVVVPIWILVVPAAMSAIVLWRLDRIAWLHQRPHLCVKCLYDRTGLPGAVVCPECGTKGVKP